MFAIITAWAKEQEPLLEADGYRKETVYIKHVPQAAKSRTESDLMRKGIFQFLVSGYWGAGPD